MRERLRREQREFSAMNKRMKEQLLAGATVDQEASMPNCVFCQGGDPSSKNPGDYELILGYVS